MTDRTTVQETFYNEINIPLMKLKMKKYQYMSSGMERNQESN